MSLSIRNRHSPLSGRAKRSTGAEAEPRRSLRRADPRRAPYGGGRIAERQRLIDRTIAKPQGGAARVGPGMEPID
jgi:hypothetical protein